VIDAGGTAVTLRVLGSLVLVLALVAVAARVARRSGGRRGGANLRVLERAGLSREASLAVVEVAGQSLVLGVTSHAVTVLTEIPPPDRPGRGERRSGPRRTAREQPHRTPPGGTGRTPREGSRRTPPEEPIGWLLEEPLPAGMRMPPAVRLGEHPDLASALRAAGRFAVPDQGRGDGEPRTTEPPTTEPPTTEPRTGRPRPAGGSRSPGPRRASDPRRSADVRRAADPRTSDPRATDPRRIAVQRRAAGRQRAAAAARQRSVGRVPAPAGRRPTGSVLDPATWRQGLEALRDLTARRP